MSSGEFNVSKLRRFNGGVDFDTDTIKIMLVKPAYTFNPDHNDIGDINANEVSCTGYSPGAGGSGRKTLTITPAQDDTNDRANIDSPDLTWTAVNGDSVGGAVIYKHTSGSDDTLNIPLLFIDFADVTFVGSDFVVQWDPLGIAYQG